MHTCGIDTALAKILSSFDWSKRICIGPSWDHFAICTKFKRKMQCQFLQSALVPTNLSNINLVTNVLPSNNSLKYLLENLLISFYWCANSDFYQTWNLSIWISSSLEWQSQLGGNVWCWKYSLKGKCCPVIYLAMTSNWCPINMQYATSLDTLCD